MASVGTYLNFTGETEAAFEFYKSIFGGEYVGTVSRFGDIPATQDMPPLPDDQGNLIMNIGLEITGGHLLMGSDLLGPLADSMITGTNVHISVMPDDRAEADRLFAALSEGGSVTMPLSDQFWGDYWGSLTDRFGIQWMISTTSTG